MRRVLFLMGLAASVFTAAAAPASATPTAASSVTYDIFGRDFVLTDNASDVLNVSPGSTFTVTGTWAITNVDNSFCPGCILQLYVAGDASMPGQANLFSGGIGVSNQSSGTYSLTLTAPNTVGTSYIGGAATAEFNYVPVTGGPDAAGFVNYQVDVSEPASLAVLGLGILAIGAVRHRRLAGGIA